jgi:hypothetical protein
MQMQGGMTMLEIFWTAVRKMQLAAHGERGMPPGAGGPARPGLYTRRRTATTRPRMVASSPGIGV